MKTPIEQTIPLIENRNPGVEKLVSMAIKKGLIPLLVGNSGTGKTSLAIKALDLPCGSSDKLLNLYTEQSPKKLSRAVYFEPTINGKLLIDEIGCYEQGDELNQVLAEAISHEMNVVITAQRISDIDPQILKNERIVQINLY